MPSAIVSMSVYVAPAVCEVLSAALANPKTKLLALEVEIELIVGTDKLPEPLAGNVEFTSHGAVKLALETPNIHTAELGVPLENLTVTVLDDQMADDLAHHVSKSIPTP